MDRFFLTAQSWPSLHSSAQVYIMDDSKTVEAYLESVNASVIEFVRFEVGEVLKKLQMTLKQKLQLQWQQLLTTKNKKIKKEVSKEPLFVWKISYIIV